jgi:hypothetical protein
VKERWVAFPEKGFCDYFQVSNYGNVARIRDIYGNRIWKRISGHKKKRTGHIQIDILCEGYKKSFKVSRIVYKAFGKEVLGEKDQIKHIDGNPSNNYIGNLKIERRNQIKHIDGNLSNNCIDNLKIER